MALRLWVGIMVNTWACATMASEAHERGCFHESAQSKGQWNASTRQLPHQVCELSGPCATLSRGWCGAACARLNFTLAGVEAGHQCACGNALLNASAIAPASACNRLCTGTEPWARQTCGGVNTVEVFPVKSAPPIPPPLPAPQPPEGDHRWVGSGDIIHTCGDHPGCYCCQPYCFVHTDGEWSCVMTFNNESWIEGTPGEHMVALNTKDQGKTWSPMVDIEPGRNLIKNY